MSALLLVLFSLPALHLCLPNKITDFVPLPSLPEIGDGKPNNSTIKTKKVFLLSENYDVNWRTAERTCVVHGMHLASITSQQENDQLTRLMRKYHVPWVWIGATDLGSDGHFYWVSNGASFDYENWGIGETLNYDRNDEQCMVMRLDGIWNYWKCSNTSHFACEAYVAA